MKAPKEREALRVRIESLSAALERPSTPPRSVREGRRSDSVELTPSLSAESEEADHARGKIAQRRAAVIGLSVLFGLGAVGVGFVVWNDSRRATGASEKSLAPLGRPFLSQGFRQVAFAGGADVAKGLEINTDGCVVALAAGASGAVPVVLKRADETVAGAPYAALCLCGSEQVSVRAVGNADGIALFRIDAATLGGGRGLATLAPPVTAGKPAEGCDREQFASFLSGPGKRLAEGAIARATKPAVSALTARGFSVIAFEDGPRGYVAVPMKAGGCYLATGPSPTLHDERDAVLTKGAGAIVWCEPKVGTRWVGREGPGEITLYSAPSQKIGGLLGALDASGAPGASVGTWLAPEELADAAMHLLATLGVRGKGSESVAADAESRVVALARGDTRLALDTAPMKCAPALDAGVAATLCVLPAGQSWLARVPLLAGAVASLPAALSVMASVKDPLGVAAVSSVLSLTRRLRREGFEPTTLEAITERPGAVEITGRADEDAIVVVSVGPTAPFLAMPTETGAPWAIDGPPRVIPLATGAKIVLRSPRLAGLSPATRRSIVFRRAKAASGTP